MARVRTAKHPKPIEPESESQEIPEEEAAVVIEPEPEPEGEGPSKSEAARQAIKSGYEKPGEAVAWIKKTFGIEMGAQHFSSIKSQMKKKEGEAAPKAEPAKRGPKPKAPLVEGDVAPPENPKSAGEPDLLLALENVKELVGQFGAEKLKRMVDLMG